MPIMWDDDLDDQDYNSNILNLPDDVEDDGLDDASDEDDPHPEDQYYPDPDRDAEEYYQEYYK